MTIAKMPTNISNHNVFFLFVAAFWSLGDREIRSTTTPLTKFNILINQVAK